MSTTFVAIDVETTGLDPDRDEIIEVAAITFRDNDILDEFTTLVNPGRELPDEIIRLTGITPQMVQNAPRLLKIRSQLRRVLGDHVLVGHNVQFDLGFLRAARLGQGQPHLDTMTLASILAPEAGRYGLEALAWHLRLPETEGRHRARDDAEQTVELFLALRERALALSPAQLEEIAEAGERIGWPETLFFQEMLALKMREAFTGGERREGRPARLFHPPKLEGETADPVDPPRPLDTKAIVDMMRPGGNFSRAFSGFEHRPQQIEMLRAVAEAFNEGRHLLVEAGTGTGKSLAYLLPAAFWAHENGRRVVISTNTINLQDQLIHKDIPDLQRVLPFTLRAAVRKGRSNYLCTRLFQQLRRNGPNDDDEMALLARILLWLPRTKTGDVAELPLRSRGERLAWARLNGENRVCTPADCSSAGCPLHAARRGADLAHLVIVNHALLLADIAAQNMVLPEFSDLIIDEGHHLESAVTDGLSVRVDKRVIETVLDDVTRPRAGLLGHAQRQVKQALSPSDASRFDALVEGMRRQGEGSREEVDDFFNVARRFLREFGRENNQFADQVRLVPALRTQPAYDDLLITWDNLGKSLASLAKGFEQVGKAIAEIDAATGLDGGEELRAALGEHGRTLAETHAHMEQIISQPRDDFIYWGELYNDWVSFHAAPLHIGPLVEEHIFRQKDAVVITSATLRTAGVDGRDDASFTYLQERLNANHAEGVAVGSPFDYKNATLLYLPTDMPEPNQPGYQRHVEQAILDVATTLHGRTMALFTSYSQLNRTADAIAQPLADAGITLLAQRSGSSRQQLLEQFKQEGSRSVLLGTRSFWEGVDMPGPTLQAVLLVRLPFDVPSDPIVAARSETFDSPFFQYTIPEAVLRFRQGFGRLIRRQDDEGVVVVLDKRVLTKRYGRLFLQALPECMVLRQRIGRVGELTLRWLNRDKSQKF